MTFDYLLRISPKCGIFPSKIIGILKALIHTTEKCLKKRGIPHYFLFTNITILFPKLCDMIGRKPFLFGFYSIAIQAGLFY